jgi:hypothetical protein
LSGTEAEAIDDPTKDDGGVKAAAGAAVALA